MIPRASASAEAGTAPRARVVVVGAGFGGLAAVKSLARAPVTITVVDRQNYHLFQPLLYQVATASLSPADIAWPIRRLLRRQSNARVLLDEVTGVDAKHQVVRLSADLLPYDYLVLAPGVRHHYFGHGEWEPYAPGLKQLDDATGIRRRVLLAFERAEMEGDERERERLLSFVIVGAGPTGVELAGAIVELARRALSADFRHIDPRSARILLVEAGPRVLPAFPESLSQFALRSLARLGVEVRLGTPLTACDAAGVTLGDTHIPAATVLWAAGVAAGPAAQWLGAKQDRAGRVLVQPDLSVPGLPNVYVLGDAALMLDPKGRPVPGIASAAKQAGRYVARLIEARATGKAPPPAFRYHHWGTLATIGRRTAIIDFGWLRLKGAVAWWFWGLVHIYFLISLRNRLAVALQWFWSYLTFERGARLITGPDRAGENK